LGRYATSVNNLQKPTTKKNGGVGEHLMDMEFVKMETKRIAIDGVWLDLYFFKEGDGSVRIEVENHISGKRYKMFPSNKIIFEEN